LGRRGRQEGEPGGTGNNVLRSCSFLLLTERAKTFLVGTNSAADRGAPRDRSRAPTGDHLKGGKDEGEFRSRSLAFPK
jgi:hypothetical protein